MPGYEFEYKGIKSRNILRNEKCKVKQFILDNFYDNAVIPKALKLRQTWPKYELLNDELDLMMDSESSFLSFDQKNAELVGAIVNTIWKVDEDHEPFEVDPLLWLNTAQEITLEETNDILYQTVIWRDLQFQLIYHLCQTSAIQRDDKFIFYSGMGFVEPYIRDRGSVSVFRQMVLNFSKSTKGFPYMFVGTYPGFNSMIERTFPNCFDTLAYIPYKSINLKCFQNLEDGMILLRTK